MRKRYRSKRRSCSICKPNKMGFEIRFKVKEFELRKRTEKEINESFQNNMHDM